MQLPGERFSFKQKRKRKGILGKVLIVIVIASVSYPVYNIVKKGNIILPFSNNPGKNEKIMAMWESHQYVDLISFTDELLIKNSTDFHALVFNGFFMFL